MASTMAVKALYDQYTDQTPLTFTPPSPLERARAGAQAGPALLA